MRATMKISLWESIALSMGDDLVAIKLFADLVEMENSFNALALSRGRISTESNVIRKDFHNYRKDNNE